MSKMKRPTITFPPVLLNSIDNAFGPLGYQNRSAFVRQACREKIRRNYQNLPESVQNAAPVAPQ